MRQATRAIAVGLCAWGVLAAGVPDAKAQRPILPWGEELPVEEQPGVVPDPDAERLPAAFQRQLVFFRTTEPPGTIIINTSERFLYLVQGNNRALRYGIGVGRDGFQWSGLLRISRKAEWPDWIPPPEMIERQPYLPRFMAGGPGNPLGARALYLGNTVYRHQSAADDRTCRVIRLFPPRERRCDRSLRPGAGRHQGHRAPESGALGEGYAERFAETSVGTKSPLGIPRGLNHLWTMGGIQYAPPIR